MKKILTFGFCLSLVWIAVYANAQRRLYINHVRYESTAFSYLGNTSGPLYQQRNTRELQWFRQGGSSVWWDPYTGVGSSTTNQIRFVNNSIEVAMDANVIGRNYGDASVASMAAGENVLALEPVGGPVRVQLEYHLIADGVNDEWTGPFLEYFVGLFLGEFGHYSEVRGTNTGLRREIVTLQNGPGYHYFYFFARTNSPLLPINRIAETGVARLWVRMTPLDGANFVPDISPWIDELVGFIDPPLITTPIPGEAAGRLLYQSLLQEVLDEPWWP